jgi:ABC-2 type transport system permease protein
MINIIRSDVFRIIRGKGLYITLAVFLVVILMQVIGGANMNAGIDPSVMDMDMDEIENLEFSDFFNPPTGLEAPLQVMSSSANILYFLLPLIIFISAADFNSGAAKNTLASGVSRACYYSAKLILSCIACALLLLLYLLLSVLGATLFNGFGGEFSAAFVSETAKVFLMQLWLCLACACVINFLAFAFRRSAAVIGWFIGFMLVPSVLILLLAVLHKWFENLFDYELSVNIGAAVGISNMPACDIIKMLAVGAVYAAAATAGGYLLFRKADVK